MRRNKLDFFAFFPKDCEADESIRLMDDAQLGFWIRLMCYQWPNGSVPADVDLLLRGVLGTAPGGVPRTGEYIRGMLSGPVGQRMQPHPELAGRLADPRLLKERQIAESASTRARGNREGKAAVETPAPDVRPGPLEPPRAEPEPGVTPTLQAAFERLSARYPQCTNVDLAFQIWMQHCDAGVVTEANVHEVEEGLTRYLDSDLWARDSGRYIESFHKWLLGKKWRDRPAPSVEAKAAKRVERRSSDGSDPNAIFVAPWKKTNGD